MNIIELFNQVLEKMRGLFIDREGLIAILRISVRTYQDLKEGVFLEGFADMSDRQKGQKMMIVSKLAIYLEMDPEQVLIGMFTDSINAFEVSNAIKMTQKQMKRSDGSQTPLTKEDLSCLQNLLDSSTVSVTFEGAYKYLCEYRRR
jgi:hypothetical protein